MAPRKAAQKAAPASPLDGCSIGTSGKFAGTTQGALAERITSLGATVASKVTADTSFLIATEKDYESNSTKVKAATEHNIPVVTLDWFDECENTGKRLSYFEAIQDDRSPHCMLNRNRLEGRRDAVSAVSFVGTCSSSSPEEDGEWQEARCICITRRVSSPKSSRVTDEEAQDL
jgi:hypothetical protein